MKNVSHASDSGFSITNSIGDVDVINRYVADVANLLLTSITIGV